MALSLQKDGEVSISGLVPEVTLRNSECQCLLISQGPLKQPQELRGDFSGTGMGERVPSSPLAGMRSSWLKIHIQAGDWKKHLCEKGSKA